MASTRYFLGWSEPLTKVVCDYLLPARIEGVVDLESTIIVVPTRQAGRRLREALALRCDDNGAALLSARTVTPAFFFGSRNGDADEANPVTVASVWSDVFRSVKPGEFGSLLGRRGRQRDPAWEAVTGEMMQGLRSILADGAYRISDVADVAGDVIEEPERWAELAALEQMYLDRLEGLGLADPCLRKIQYAAEPAIPEGIRSIVVASVPAPARLMVATLHKIRNEFDIAILVHAPEEISSHFDEWGRPDPDTWAHVEIPVPDSSRNICLAATPEAQGGRVVEEIVSGSQEYGPGDFAIGVADRSIIQHLAEHLSEQGLLTFDPAERRISSHPLYRLIETLCVLASSGSFAELGRLLRHPDYLSFLYAAHSLVPHDVLSEFDEFRTTHLPSRLDDVGGRLSNCDNWVALRTAVEVVVAQLDMLLKLGLASGLRRLLSVVYAGRKVRPDRAEDEEFQQVAGAMDYALRYFEQRTGLTEDDPELARLLFLRQLAGQTYNIKRRGTPMDLEGWLELPWNDAPVLVVTGMNEGCVPDSRLGDVFLPDSLRSKLGLLSDAERFARDALIMRQMIECRRSGGKTVFIAGKSGADGDPLKPSRLLFRCSDTELPGRAARLFGELQEKRDKPYWKISVKLSPEPPSDMDPDKIDMKRMRVTSFRDYLQCPFRFYLKHVLGMERQDVEKDGPDALDFGNMVHWALQAMHRDVNMTACEDEDVLAEFLAERAMTWCRERYGERMPLPAVVSLRSARKRLQKAAVAHVGLLKEGWETLHSEKKYSVSLDGMVLSGTIDRVDRHRKTGVIRIIDYKTSDTKSSPAEAHLRKTASRCPEIARTTIDGAERAWQDLQLPLYVFMFRAETDCSDVRIEPAYFNLPKAIEDTGPGIWEDFSQEICEDAVSCAQRVVGAVKNRMFWPPAERVTHDDFEDLFHDDIAGHVRMDGFERFMKGKRK